MLDIIGFLYEYIFYISERDIKRSWADILFIAVALLMLVVLAVFALKYQQDPAPVTVPALFR